jgi:hypothetical protein
MLMRLHDLPKMVAIGWLEATPQIGEMLPQKLLLLNLTLLYFTLPYLFFLYVSTAKTAEPICTHDGSNDAVCSKQVSFGVALIGNYISGSKTPENPKSWNRDARFPVN